MPSTADQVAEVVRRLAEGVAFPGRVRLFCDERLAAALPPFLAAERAWPEAGGGVLLAAACGAAWAERERGGRVLVIAPRAALDEGRWWEAVALAARLELHHLVLLIPGATAADLALMAAWGWEAGDPGHLLGTRAPAAHAWPELDSGDHVPALGVQHEWPPVRLATLPVGGLPPWPMTTADTPGSPPDRWLSWLAAREPRLLGPHLVRTWSALPDSAAKLVALAHLASEGVRVCWSVPAGTSVIGWMAELIEIGWRGLPLKLICAAADLPPLACWPALPGWWMVSPADDGELAAVLAQILDNEDAVVVALADGGVQAGPWPLDQAYVPGSGRWLARGDAVTLVCESRSAAVALQARTALGQLGVEAAVLHCTSLHPLPFTDLEHAAERSPLVVCSADPVESGLGAATLRQLAGLLGARSSAVGPEPGQGPLRSEAIVARVRAVLALSLPA